MGIRQELIDAVGIKERRGEEKADHWRRVIIAVGELDDPSWAKISKPAQDYYNDAADALNKKQDIPAPPDDKKEEPATTTRRTRTAAAEETKKAEPAAEPEVGDVVTAVTKRGKEIKGELVEINDDIVVIKEADGGETEIGRDRLESLAGDVKEAPAEEPKRRRRAAEEEAPAAPAVAEPKEGDNIKAVTKRGKTVEGKVVEVADGLVVIDDGEGELELEVDKLESLVVVVADKPAEDAPKRRRAATDEAPAAKDKDKDEKPARVTRAANGGIAATVRMREMIAEDLEITPDEIAKKLTKEGIQFRDQTLDMVHKDAIKFVALLEKAGKLKK